MSPGMKEAISQIAHRVVRNPTSATLDDVRKLARAWLIQTEGGLPKVQQRRKT